MTFDPVGPSLADVAWQNQLVPQVDELLDSNEPTDVVLVPLSENLLIHASALPAIRQVVTPRWTAPTDVQRQLDNTRSLRKVLVEILGHRWSLCGRSCKPFHDRLRVPLKTLETPYSEGPLEDTIGISDGHLTDTWRTTGQFARSIRSQKGILTWHFALWALTDSNRRPLPCKGSALAN